MSGESKNMNKINQNITLPEVLFNTLLGVVAVYGIWLSSSILIHLIQGLK